jgi:hypothetical protein
VQRALNREASTGSDTAPPRGTSDRPRILHAQKKAVLMTAFFMFAPHRKGAGTGSKLR